MPSKPSSSKKSKPSTDEVVSEELPVESAKPKKSGKDKVLSLIEEKKPRSRGATKEGSALPPLGAKKPVPAPKKEEEPAAPAKLTLDERMAAALNLF
ncbi:MAG TPA: hypothetical protein PLB55_25005 [Prosthecobacter sp.]|nr:hypothetical protein [Prosthecobacter sp.]